MEKTNYAAIDIGSNAVRLLIKSVDMEEGTASFVKEQLLRVPLRLGEDTFSVGTISKEKGKRMLRRQRRRTRKRSGKAKKAGRRGLMKSYRQLMKIYGVKRYRACATSAVRDAANGPELIREISRKTGIKIEVIGGEEEARLIYDNHIEEMLDRRYDYLYVDVGGGSTEISLISGGGLQSSRSYDIGTVRLLEGRVKEESVASLRNDMRELGAGHPGLRIIGSGGNINKLYRLAAAGCKNGMELPVSELSVINGVLKSMSSEERVRVFRMRPDRADVITFAADIFLEIAGQCGASVILVPTIGLADGIIDSLYAEDAERAGRR